MFWDETVAYFMLIVSNFYMSPYNMIWFQNCPAIYAVTYYSDTKNVYLKIDDA